MNEWPRTAEAIYAKIEYGEWTDDADKQQQLVPDDLARELYEALLRSECYDPKRRNAALDRYEREVG